MKIGQIFTMLKCLAFNVKSQEYVKLDVNVACLESPAIKVGWLSDVIELDKNLSWILNKVNIGNICYIRLKAQCPR